MADHPDHLHRDDGGLVPLAAIPAAPEQTVAIQLTHRGPTTGDFTVAAIVTIDGTTYRVRPEPTTIGQGWSR